MQRASVNLAFLFRSGGAAGWLSERSAQCKMQGGVWLRRRYEARAMRRNRVPVMSAACAGQLLHGSDMHDTSTSY